MTVRRARDHATLRLIPGHVAKSASGRGKPPIASAQGMFAEVLGSILASSSVFLTYAMLLVVRTRPWWDAQYFIPMLGMLLGNCISGISVGLTTLLEELTSGARNLACSYRLLNHQLGQQSAPQYATSSSTICLE